MLLLPDTTTTSFKQEGEASKDNDSDYDDDHDHDEEEQNLPPSSPIKKRQVSIVTPTTAPAPSGTTLADRFVAQKKSSHLTTAKWKKVHTDLSTRNFPDVDWSLDGKSIVIPDWKVFTDGKGYFRAFGYNSVSTMNRAFKRAQFHRDESPLPGGSKKVTLTNENFVRDQRELVNKVHSSESGSAASGSAESSKD